MTTGLIIFARMDSSRLPGKVLMDLCGRPLLGRVADRARRVAGNHKIVVATSDREVDDPIENFAASEGIGVFRGAAEDTLDRAIMCAKAHRLEAIVRICGDSPFIMPDIVERLIRLRERKELDLATNIFPRTYPPGISVEVVSVQALARAAASRATEDDREHCTKYLYRNVDQFKIENVSALDDRFKGIHLAVDTEQDMSRAKWIIEHIQGEPAEASLEYVADLALRWNT